MQEQKVNLVYLDLKALPAMQVLKVPKAKKEARVKQQ